ncbi:MAG: dTDP-4-amino-4,6-dideoxygalactose transaminase [Crocinitomicaceae bacterium]|jgi:dTDP-4-amino-4,6-dideoxygalactose transaminase
MKINVTEPSLPPLDEFYDSLKTIWDSKWLTNGGPFHQEFENKLAEYLEVKHLSLFSNGTLALITALQALEIEGEVITTPYSFVATSHSLWWNGIQPVFVDIDGRNFNMDPAKIEAAITPKTTAIMPVHVYGNPCDTEAIQRIADKHGLKIIYDAAHAFGVKEQGQSILNFGDLSILSFHATKVFNTIEGGAIVCHDEAAKKRIDQLKNFGFVDEVTVVAPGINAKMNEIQAAYGLLQLKYIDGNIEKRKAISEHYTHAFNLIEGITVPALDLTSNPNFSYFPILIESDFGISRDAVYEALKAVDIFARRYFYPLISEFPPYNELPSANRHQLKIAHESADKILCLPIYANLSIEDVDRIILSLNSLKEN